MNYEGVAGSPCEHRTCGGRAWCHTCTTWCYPDDGCPRCELLVAEAKVAAFESQRRVRPVLVFLAAVAGILIFFGWGVMAGSAHGHHDATTQCTGVSQQ